ncbi:MAG: hypothetical protein AVDCRST_MAG18-4276 [uncultured Thermomicrobiales bacterium]|uniref:Ribonuclease VapC n=1 Tax=uncultured Thermomicrobiales bacterium TaxID=1645740 RepID=A0A6J4VYJ1_9BACT|nr:MAG: hypothetical protein AVDCRST_MAG18-4276 [uncultured Thermomicrobiales bacterium]
MSFLFDTDTLSNLLKRAPSAALPGKLAGLPADQQAMTAITLGELVYGAARLGQLGIPLRERIERDLIANLAILPFDATAARHYGLIRADLESHGTSLAEADLRIAAIAIARNLILVTGNGRHFGRITNLTIENWL